MEKLAVLVPEIQSRKTSCSTVLPCALGPLKDSTSADLRVITKSRQCHSISTLN